MGKKKVPLQYLKIYKYLMTIRAINKITDAYLLHYPSEADRMALFTVYLVGATPDGLFDRKNFKGHITTSAFIVNTAKEEMLLLRHKSLKRWLQPGGHWEEAETFRASALREAQEETGLTQLTLHSCHGHGDIPIDIDTHAIAARPARDEPDHFHFDLRYVFTASSSDALMAQVEEIDAVRWQPFDALRDICPRVWRRLRAS